jgi:hypothetical protein
MILTIYCASCGERLGDTVPQFPCPEWHNNKEPYCLDPAYPGPGAGAVRSSSTTITKDSNTDDLDNEHDNNESQAYRDLLSALTAIGFPKSRARMALNTIYHQNIDAAVDWLNNNRPPSPELEPIPDPDPTWRQWRPIRSCFCPELTNIPARD